MKSLHPLRAYRYRNKVSLSDLAVECRTTAASLSRIERRRQAPSLAMLKRLVRSTGLSADDFLQEQVGR